MPRSGLLFDALFRAVAILARKHPSIQNFLQLNFIGTSNQPKETSRFQLLSLAERYGIAAIVKEIPERIPYLDALSALARSKVVLLIGSDEPHYTASKIYPGLMSGRPFFSLFHDASSVHKTLSAAGGGVSIAFGSGKDLEEKIPKIVDGLERLMMSPSSFAEPNLEATGCTARFLVGQFATIFESLNTHCTGVHV
jgi:hypothetical protein